jgi:hypothetical protein
VFVLISFFHYLRIIKGDFQPEETSILTPNSGAKKIFANYDGSNQTLPDGRVTNLIPFGILIGKLFSSGTSYFQLIFLTYLTFLAAYAIYKFLDIWKLQLYTFIGAFCSITFSFSFIYTSYYQTKTYGLVLFLLGSVILLTKHKLSQKLIWISLLTILTYGVIANPGTLATGLLFYLLYIFISKVELKTKVRYSLICFSVQLIIYLPGIVLYYLNTQAISAYNSNFNSQKTFFGNNLNILIGRGYWAENATVGPLFSDARYFSWLEDYSVVFDNFRIVLILCLSCFILFKMVVGELRDSDSMLKIFLITIILGYLQVSEGKWNLIYLLREWSGIFNIWREPWTKFNILFILFLNLFLWGSLDNLIKHQLSLREKLKDVRNASKRFGKSKLENKLMRRELRRAFEMKKKGNKNVFLFFTFLLISSIIFYAQIMFNLITASTSSNNFYISMKSLENTYKNIELMNSFLESTDVSTYDEIQICSNYDQTKIIDRSEYQIFLDGLFLVRKKPIFKIGECKLNPLVEGETFYPLYPYVLNQESIESDNGRILRVNIQNNKVNII